MYWNPQQPSNNFPLQSVEKQGCLQLLLVTEIRQDKEKAVIKNQKNVLADMIN